MDISIVVPLYNEDESLRDLEKWIRKVMETHNFSYEIVMVDDGSTDDSWNVVQELAKMNPTIKGIKFRRNYGKSAALHEGFGIAKGDVVVTMDADLQDSPEEVPELYRMIMKDGYDLVSGWKQKRFDPLSKTIPTKLYNAVTRMMSGIKLNDFNCGLKAYKNEVVKSIEVYGEMHRYIPVLASHAGFKKIGEKVVQHQARQFGVTKFGGIKRFINGPLDLLSIIFVGKYGKKPMHFFGRLGLLVFIAGFAILAWLAFQKLLNNEYGMTDRPLFFYGIVAFIAGIQLFLAGFLAELISRKAPDRNLYLIETYLNKD
jgi:glycosyltransferase involved in cell wall biosynthesis